MTLNEYKTCDGNCERDKNIHSEICLRRIFKIKDCVYCCDGPLYEVQVCTECGRNSYFL